MSALLAPDWSAMLRDIIDSGLPEREICNRLGLEELSPQLLRFYAKGTQPLFPRGHVIYVLWLEVTGRAESDIHWLPYIPPHRVERRHTQVEKCHACGQALRGRRLADWQQLQMHHETHGDPDAMPSWLSPKVKETMMAAKSIGGAPRHHRVIRARDDEPGELVLSGDDA